MQAIIIDDRDVEIVYQPADLWSHQQGQPNEEYRAGTYSQGLTGASLNFRFNGTEVAVYGVADPRPMNSSKDANPPAATFTVDGIIPMTVLSDPDIQVQEYAHQFFNSHALHAGEHVLQVNIKHGTAEWPFVLDYIQYTPLPHAPSNGPGDPIAAASSSPSRQKVVTAVVVASVVGLVVILGLGALVVRYWMRSKKTNADKGEQGPFMYHISKSRTKMDLLEEEEKSQPCSPERLSEEMTSTYARSSNYGGHESVEELPMYLDNRSPRLVTEYLLHPSGQGRTSCAISDTEYGVASRPSSPTHIHPDTPSTHVHTIAIAYQRSLAPSTRSRPSLTRTGTSSTASALSLSRPNTPPTAAHTSGSPYSPAIVYRAATPDSLVYTVMTLPSRMGSPSPSATSTGSSVAARQAGKEVEVGYWKSHTANTRAATFHSDSGVRFKEDDLLLGHVPVPARMPHAAAADPTLQPFESHPRNGVVQVPVPVLSESQLGTGEVSRRKEEEGSLEENTRWKRVSYAASAISQVPPMYTEY